MRSLESLAFFPSCSAKCWPCLMLQLSISLMEVFSTAGALAIEGVERRKGAVVREVEKEHITSIWQYKSLPVQGPNQKQILQCKKQGCWDNSWAIPHTWPPGELHRCFYCAFCLYTHFRSPSWGYAHQCSLRGLYRSTGPSQKWKMSAAVWKAGLNAD